MTHGYTWPVAFFASIFLFLASAGARIVVSGDGVAIQRAIDENPGCTIVVPDGQYEIDQTIVIRADGTRLIGPGTIVQTNPEVRIIEISEAKEVLLRDLTLTRAEGKMDTEQIGIYGEGCDGIQIDNVRVLDNRGGRAAIYIDDSHRVRIERCEVVNYKSIAIDDRLNSDIYRYAFRCINGAGIVVHACRVSQILNNRVIEENLLPTRETYERYDLGRIVEKREESGRFTPDGDLAEGWHQGSAIEVHSPLVSSHALLQGNYIENASQGFDVHADMIIITQNHVNNCHTGIKTMHGGRHVMISNNIVERADDEGIYLGTDNSYRAKPAEGDNPPVPANTNNGCIVSNNIISEMGYGLESWFFWKPGPDQGKPYGIKVKGISYDGELMRDNLVIMGNAVYHSGPDGMIEDGEVVFDNPPHYKYALWIEPEAFEQMKNLRVFGNVFDPGEFGITNVDLPE